MPGAKIGYVRVSTVDQNSGRQLEGMELEKVFEDKVSGWSIDRPGWTACKDYLREGDTLYVHSIDRLARNLEDLQKTVRGLTEKGVTIRFVKENLVFEGKTEPLQVLLFQVLGAFAQFEREMIKERQREGIEKAKQEGKYRGRGSYKLTKEQMERIQVLLDAGVPKTRIAERLGVRVPVIYKVLAGDIDPRKVRSEGEMVSK
jgi:DNA invertase Pin-like site-specific DNA recombinase